MTDYSSRAATRRASCNTGSPIPKPAPVTLYQIDGGSYHVQTAGERHARELLERMGRKMPERPKAPAAPKIQRKRVARLAAPASSKRERSDKQRFKDMMYRRARRALERFCKARGWKFDILRSEGGYNTIYVGALSFGGSHVFDAMEVACDHYSLRIRY